MPKSARRIKPLIKQYIVSSLTDTNSSILDCGAGAGTYANLLSENGELIYRNIDCCEIYEPYIKKYNLYSKYKNVFVGDICDLKFDYYDMIIMGDVLEHIERSRAQKLIINIYSKCTYLLIAIPYLYEQGPYKGNIYESHLQPDLTHNIFMEYYEGFKLLLEKHNIGVYIKI